MPRFIRRAIQTGLLSLFAFNFSIAGAVAQPTVGEPHDGYTGLQLAASPVKENIEWLYTGVTYVIAVITIFVMVLLLIVIFRYNRRANPVPSTRTHHVKLEIVWTLVPVIILAVIAVPSLTLIYYQDRTPSPEMTLKVTGHQWYWSYEYPDQGNYAFDSRPVWVGPQTTQAEVDQLIAESKPNYLIDAGAPRRLLEVDNRIVLPVDTNIRVLITGADVIHSWAVPALGVKRDAIPGRTNETWVRITKPGLYFGQCSEICGTGHGYMPIAVEAVSKEQFAAWTAGKAPQGTGSPAQAVSDSAKATEKTATGLDGETKPAVQADPSKAAVPAEASPLEKTPPPSVPNPSALPPKEGGATGNTSPSGNH